MRRLLNKLFFLFLFLFVVPLAALAGLAGNHAYVYVNASCSNNTEYYSTGNGNLTAYETGTANRATGALLLHDEGLIVWNCSVGDMNATLEIKPYGAQTWIAIPYRDNSTIIEMNSNTGAHTITTKTDSWYRVRVTDFGSGQGEIWLQK